MPKVNAEKRMRELEALLEYHSRLYYELDTPEIEDAEYNNLSKDILAVLHRALAIVVAEGVVVGIRHLRADSIARREVKHHNIAFLHLVPTFQAFILPLWVIEIALSTPRESMLHERHR